MSTKSLRCGSRKLPGDLLDDIYEIARDPDHWHSVLDRLCRLTHSRTAMLVAQTSESPRAIVHASINISQRFLQSYADRFAHCDVWTQPAAVTALPGTAWIEDFAASKTADGRAFHAEWLKLQGIGLLLHVVIARREPDKTDPAEIVYIVFGRDADVGGYSDRDVASIDELIPHLRRALKFQSVVSSMRARYRAVLKALDALSIGVVLVNWQREPIAMNQCAHDSFGINGCTMSAITNSLLSDKGPIRHAAASPTGRSAVPDKHIADRMFRTVVSGSPDLRPLTATVCRLDDISDHLSSTRDPAAIVFLSDPSRKVKLDEEMIRHLYGLTKAEAHLAVLLAEGGHLDEVAKRLNISIHTARTHLKRIFSKTNTERQIDLVRLLLHPWTQPRE